MRQLLALWEHDGGASGKKIDTCLWRRNVDNHVRFQQDRTRDAGPVDCSDIRPRSRDGAHVTGWSYSGQDVPRLEDQRRKHWVEEEDRALARKVCGSAGRMGHRRQQQRR